MKPTRTKLAPVFLPFLTLLTLVGASSDGSAAEPFGPIEQRGFVIKPGTALEKPGAGCSGNSDVLFINGPNVSSLKSVDVTPKVGTFDNQKFVPTNLCAAPNCAQILVKVSESTPPGPRTVTLKHTDGRTTTTTFDIVDNTSGRCDARSERKGPPK